MLASVDTTTIVNSVVVIDRISCWSYRIALVAGAGDEMVARAFPEKAESGIPMLARICFKLPAGRRPAWMAKPYSEDLRRRVVEASDNGATIPDAAEQCGVSISSVVRFLRLQRETGSVSAAKFGGYKEFALAAHEELVRSLIVEQPDITLAELETRLAKKKVMVGKSSISRFLDHLELPFKKKSAGRRAGSAGRRRRA